MNKQRGKIFVVTENFLTLARGEGLGEVGEKVEGIKKYKLVVTK